MTQTNRRHFPRTNEKASIQVFITPDHLADPKDKSVFIPAKMVNQSEDGLYIEIDRALQPGSNVHFRMVEPEKDHPEEAYFIHDGRVVWCSRLEKETSCFGIGVKILNKFVQAEILTTHLDRPA